MGITSKTRGKSIVGGMQVGVSAGSNLNAIILGNADVDPDEIADGGRGTVDVAADGVRTADTIVPIPPSDLEDGLIPAGASVESAGTISFYIVNAAGEAVDGASKSWAYLVFRS